MFILVLELDPDPEPAPDIDKAEKIQIKHTFKLYNQDPFLQKSVKIFVADFYKKKFPQK